MFSERYEMNDNTNWGKKSRKDTKHEKREKVLTVTVLLKAFYLNIADNISFNSHTIS